jgi:hypothetical protein
MNIGILYPASDIYPSMGMDFIEGIKVFLKQQGLLGEHQLYFENAGFGGVEKEVKEKIEKLMINNDADLLVLFIDQKILLKLIPFLQVWGKLVIVVNPGADYPQSWTPLPNIIHLNLQQAFLCWLTGALAVQDNVPLAAMATSFYDCGYLHSTLMVNQFTAKGGSITFNYVNNQLYNENFHIKELTAYLEGNEKTSKLLCIFDSLPASLFYQQINSFKQADQLQLYVSPMMLESKALQHIGSGFSFSIDGYKPWLPNNEAEANQEFIKVFQQQLNKNATLFSLLGWETGMVLHQIFSLENGKSLNASEIVKQLISLPINGPRGKMTLNIDTHNYLAPVVQCSLPKNKSDLKTELILDIEKEWSEYIINQIKGSVSGWTNTYLCY